jgi:hypothetical protein
LLSAEAASNLHKRTILRVPRKPAEKDAKSKRRARQSARTGEDLTGEARLIAQEELPEPPELNSERPSTGIENPERAAPEQAGEEADQNTAGSLVPFDPLSLA